VRDAQRYFSKSKKWPWRLRPLVHISCELFLACVFVSSRDAPTLAITTTDLKPSGYPSDECDWLAALGASE
jgi:hypothetical protein